MWGQWTIPGGVLIQVTQTYTEVLQVFDADGITKKVKQSVLQHASVAVAGWKLVSTKGNHEEQSAGGRRVKAYDERLQ